MQVPLEPSIRENCRLKFSSILADLSAMVLPHPAQEDEGAKSSYKGGAWGVGLMEDGQHFVTALFWTAQQLMGMGGVTPSPTFSDEVCVCVFPTVFDILCRRSWHGKMCAVL